jgi:hypothetical protein
MPVKAIDTSTATIDLVLIAFPSLSYMDNKAMDVPTMDIVVKSEA